MSPGINDLHSAMLPVFIVCKILAITPYSVHGSLDACRLVVTKKDIIINIIQYIVLAQLYFYLEIYMSKEFSHLVPIDRLTSKAQHYSIILLAISSVTLFHLHRQQIFHIFTSLQDIDKELRQINVHIDYRIVRKYSLCQSAMRLCLSSLILISHFLELGKRLKSNVILFYDVLLAISGMNPCYVLVILFDIRYKYSLINNKLNDMFKHEFKYTGLRRDLTRISVSSSGERDNIVSLKKLMIIHGQLYDLCTAINSIYNKHLVLMILSCFTSITVTGYDVMNSKASNIELMLMMCNKFFFTLYNIAQILLLVQNLQSCCTEANKTATVLNDARYNNCSSELEQRISTSIILLNLRKLKFTAYELFIIDNTLLYTMVAAVSTYLIILYQFKNAA